MSWSHYLVQVNIYLVLFYTFYRLLLARETYFMLNRIYLICAGIFSLIIPFMQIEWFSKQEISQQIYVQVSQMNYIIVQPITDAPMQYGMNWGLMFASLYLLGAAFFTIRFFLRIYAVKKMLTGVKSGLAFSFWKQKVVAQNLPEVATVNHHEDIHIKQLHTFDIIFFEILGIITWFNPIIYFYKETVKSIHEYLADEAAAKFQGDKETYAMLLLNQAFGINMNKLTNGFFKKSMIKKRIFMLYKERSKKIAILKYGIVVPLFASALLLSSATIKKNDRILAVASQIEFEEVKDAVVETLRPPKENIAATKIVENIETKAEANQLSEEKDLTSFYKYLSNTIMYPSTAAKNNIQGDIVATFNVVNNKIQNVRISQRLGYGLDEEASVSLAKYTGGVLENGNYDITVAYRLNGSSLTVAKQNTSKKPGYRSLNPIVVIGYTPQSAENDLTAYELTAISNPASFPGGLTDFYKFLAENIKYPEEAKKAGIEGKVFVSFIIEKDGSLTDIKINRKLGYGTDEEAVRVLKLSPKWTPGSNEGNLVRVKYNLPIAFTLNQKRKNQEVAQDNTVYSYVSISKTGQPLYPDGIEKFYQFIGENIKYPKEAAENKIQGSVFVSFTVETDGSLTDIKIDRKLGYGTDEEAVRVIKLSKKWHPASQGGKPVRARYSVPIKFTLNKQ